MNLRETILSEHSKAQANKIIKWIGADQKKFDELFALFTGDDKKLVQRSAWPLSYIVIAHPQLIQKHYSKLFRYLQKQGLHDAVKRNSIRFLQDIAIPEKYHGDVMNLCFTYITDPKEKPAVKAFSLTVLQKLARQYPDIKNELKVVIESQWENESAAFRSRAKKILKELS